MVVYVVGRCLPINFPIIHRLYFLPVFTLIAVSMIYLKKAQSKYGPNMPLFFSKALRGVRIGLRTQYVLKKNDEKQCVKHCTLIGNVDAMSLDIGCCFFVSYVLSE